MSEVAGVERRVAELRENFDRTFGFPAAPAPPEIEDLLAMRVAGDPYAVPLRDIAALIPTGKVAAVPAAARHLLGVAGVRGSIVPVFRLAGILGYGESRDPLRWMVLCGDEEPIALAFADFEGYLRVAKDSLQTEEHLSPTRPYVRQVVRTEERVRAVVSVPLVVAAIRDRDGPHREQ